MRIACSLAARRPEPPMRPMIRLGNLNARPSCPAAAPGSTVWVYLYAAGHRDMPGDSPAGNGHLSGIKAQSGKIADTCAKEKPPPRGADGGQTAWRGAGIFPAGTRAAYRFTGHTPVPSQTAAPVERGRNLHLHEPDSPEQHIFTEHTPATKKNRRPENRRRLDLQAAQAMR